MKKSLLLLLLFAGFVVFVNSQEESKTRYSIDDPIIPNENGIVVFSDVVDVEGASAEYLYTSGRLWALNRFRHVENLLQTDDPTKYLITGKGFIVTNVKYSFTTEEEKLFFEFKIECNDEQYSIEMKNIRYNSFEGNQLKIENLITEQYLYRLTGRPKRMNLAYKEATINFINDCFSGLNARINLLLNENQD